MGQISTDRSALFLLLQRGSARSGRCSSMYTASALSAQIVVTFLCVYPCRFFRTTTVSPIHQCPRSSIRLSYLLSSSRKGIPSHLLERISSMRFGLWEHYVVRTPCSSISFVRTTIRLPCDRSKISSQRPRRRLKKLV